jgi:hypothetical protein
MKLSRVGEILALKRRIFYVHSEDSRRNTGTKIDLAPPVRTCQCGVHWTDFRENLN